MARMLAGERTRAEAARLAMRKHGRPAALYTDRDRVDRTESGFEPG